MNDLTQQPWFYTHEGAQAGPVDFRVLQAKAREGNLNPRQDRIWSQGMADWKLAGEVAGLFEKRTVEEVSGRPPVVANRADPYTPPVHQSHGVASISPAEWPGARRRSYLFMVVVFPILCMVALGIMGTSAQEGSGNETQSLVATGAAIIPGVVGIVFGLMRLTNLGMSRWWFFGNFVPFLNLWLGYRCFSCPAGYAVHKKMDGIGIFLAIVYWLILVLVVVGVIAFAALMAGEMGTPELRQQILQALEDGSKVPATP